MWIKCPVCNGTGLDNTSSISATAFPICPVCSGERIISEINGLPPFYQTIDSTDDSIPPVDDTQLSNSNPENKQKNISIDISITQPGGNELYSIRYNTVFTTLQEALKDFQKKVILLKYENPEMFKDIIIK